MLSVTESDVRRAIAGARTMVVKVGSSSLTQPSGHLDVKKLNSLVCRAVDECVQASFFVAFPTEFICNRIDFVNVEIHRLPRLEMLCDHVYIAVEIHRVKVATRGIGKPRIYGQSALPFLRHVEWFDDVNVLVEFRINKPFRRREFAESSRQLVLLRHGAFISLLSR